MSPAQLQLTRSRKQPTPSKKTTSALRRVVIEGVSPEIDQGFYPAKAVVGDEFRVEADIYADGHELLSGFLLFRKEGQAEFDTRPLEALANDRWHASFPLQEVGIYEFYLEAWVDPFKTWVTDLEKRIQAGQDITVDLIIGARLLEKASLLQKKNKKTVGAEIDLASLARALQKGGPESSALETVLSPDLSQVMARYPDRKASTIYPKILKVQVDPPLARFGSWYEMFPRSQGITPGVHGTFRDCIRRLPDLAAMGFDVLYLPPIHPIGKINRKGPNNSLNPAANDPGSPWAIGSDEGGHKSAHPQLGNLNDFHQLVQEARNYRLEIALDLAYQCAPDHPYVKKHPEWFTLRPDGAIQYAENPPKKYQDIYPFNFNSSRKEALWTELKSIVAFWIDQGVRVFRVDNPHTKPFPFWEWLITSVKETNPEVIFLAEAFTRPKIMYHLAKLGFSQSYTYFTWRNSAHELTQYFSELTQTEIRHFFRPNLFINTPDILHEYLQIGGRAAFTARLILAATLGATYGVYGPPFELMEHEPLKPGSEEYLNSEKYEIRHWDVATKESLAGLITQVNRIRREHTCLQKNERLVFHPAENHQILCYSKSTPDNSEIILTVVNLDPHHRQWSWIHLDVEHLSLKEGERFQVHDLLTDNRYLWQGSRNYVELNPHILPAHIFRIGRRMDRFSGTLDEGT